MQAVSTTLEKLEIGTARTFGGLTVFPLIGPWIAGGERPYKTLDQALADGTVRVSEVDEGGRVPELSLVNDGDLPVLLLDGEEVVGAKQNRILNLSILAPAKAKIIIPVSCVEAGRWSRISAHFMSERHLMPSLSRRRKTVQVSYAMAYAGVAHSDQREIWNDIAELSARHAVDSPTSEMREVFYRRALDLDEYVAAFPTVDRQVGALFALGDEVRGVELFDRDSTLRELLPKVLRSWALDAVALGPVAQEVPTVKSARAFLDEVAQAERNEHAAVGLGRDVRLSGQRLAGGALVHEGQVVHLCAFRLDENEGRRRDRGEYPDFRITRERIARLEQASLRRRRQGGGGGDSAA